MALALFPVPIGSAWQPLDRRRQSRWRQQLVQEGFAARIEKVPGLGPRVSVLFIDVPAPDLETAESRVLTSLIPHEDRPWADRVADTLAQRRRHFVLTTNVWPRISTKLPLRSPPLQDDRWIYPHFGLAEAGNGRTSLLAYPRTALFLLRALPKVTLPRRRFDDRTQWPAIAEADDAEERNWLTTMAATLNDHEVRTCTVDLPQRRTLLMADAGAGSLDTFATRVRPWLQAAGVPAESCPWFWQPTCIVAVLPTADAFSWRQRLCAALGEPVFASNVADPSILELRVPASAVSRTFALLAAWR